MTQSQEINDLYADILNRSFYMEYLYVIQK